MAWLSQNWVWALLLVAFIGMHLFSHGGHGGHDDVKFAEKDATSESKQGSGHQH